MPALYERLLGDAWHGLPPAVRELHEGAQVRHAEGTFTVTNAGSWLGWLAVRLFLLPRAGENVPMVLRIESTEAGEHWGRDFAGLDMTTHQYERDGLLAERGGPLELTFRLSVVDGKLCYELMGAWICLWRWRFRLPRFLGPHVRACEWVEPGESTMRTRIEVSMPLMRPLLVYGGSLERRGALASAEA